jgi:CspA family cold shock protein
MQTGTTVLFNAQKGWGFIKDEDTGTEYFCHFSAILMDGYKKLDVGDEVTFDVETGPKGKPQACNVRVTRKAAHNGVPAY